LPRSFVEGAGPNQRRALPYDNLAASLNAFDEGVLIYELNLRLNREPLNTNAPDQGYPPIRGIKQVSLAGN
jgi:hypothetical protein